MKRLLEQCEQKFFRGQRVKITDNMPVYMSHFESDCEAVVDHSYRDDHGGDSVDSFSLVLDLPNGPSQSAWYEADQLTLVDSDRDKGEAFLQAYNSL